MLFKPGDKVSIIKINGYNYAMPVLPANYIEEVKTYLTTNGYNFDIHNLNDEITEVINDQSKVAELDCVKAFPIQSILIATNQFVSRESRVLLDQFGVKSFLNGSPRIFMDVFLVMDDTNGTVFAVKNLKPGYRLIEKTNGYFKSNDKFSCEYGEYTYIK